MVKLSLSSRPLFATLALLAFKVPATASAVEPEGCRPLVRELIEAAIQSQRVPARRPSWRSDSARTEADVMAPAASASAPSVEKAASAPAEAKKSAEAQGGARGAAASGPGSYSRTNTQEQAVDEGDIVKTDGRTIYHVSCSRDGEASACRNELRIYASWPADQARLLGRFAIEPRGGEPVVKQVYLLGAQLAIILDAQAALRPERPAFDGKLSRVLIVDVRDPRRPLLMREHLVDGSFSDARLIGSRLYLATRSAGPALPPALAQDVSALISQAATAGVEPTADEVIERLLPRWRGFLEQDPGLPRLQTISERGPEGEPRPAYACADLNVSATVSARSGLLNIVQLDLRGGATSGAGAAGFSLQSTLYASEGAIYLADPGASGLEPGWQSASLIRKFELQAAGRPRFVASGSVRGTVLNQFAMSEQGGDLRVATSDGWASNNLTVLRPQGGQLQAIGRLENLAANERIYAVRMMGDRGYVVTFRRTDPLFTLDLSDPTRPAVVGELKVEGWSNYLHPLGKNHLLAVGQDADAWGRATGFHLQIFDVSDPRRPVRKFHQKLEAGSMSDAQTDHHAFMFEPQTLTLSVPWKSDRYFGLLAYRVDPAAGFVDLGRVNHALMFKRYFQQQCARSLASECQSSNYWYNFVTRPAIAIDRVIAIDDQLYSLSPAGMMVHRAGRTKLSSTTSVLVSEPRWRARGTPVAVGW